jgi:hypothetical protein
LLGPVADSSSITTAPVFDDAQEDVPRADECTTHCISACLFWTGHRLR